ncbi:double zinc ribbon domain-containing protein [Halopiger djelfimassiliensis]|uniref:double zinc ribbon domain-containing protein n=1 Tax=Halopiger djelfimassiliensis TaxID=1293047 RepID=UPI000677C6F0|nr:zinc ribbon domain-containing protein [Halopiger djelfimassiliensis]
MSKITFRADDDLVEQLEALDRSKSEAMREALRSYLDEGPSYAEGGSGESDRSGPDEEPSIDDLVRERVDDLLAKRLESSYAHPRTGGRDAQDVNVTISLEGDAVRTATHEGMRSQSRGKSAGDDGTHARGRDRETQAAAACGQCGESVDDEHVYCPNCGEKTSHRLFCECGDELRSDWSFCPSCGRRTPAADVLESERQNSRRS